MSSDFFDHYINQLINEECVTELIVLKHEYQVEKKKIEENRTVKDGAAFELKSMTGKKITNTPRNELIQLESAYREKAKQVAVKHAKAEKKLVVVLKDQAIEKSTTKELTEKKIELTEKNFDAVQARMQEKANLRKQITMELEERNKGKVQERPLASKPEPDQTRDKKAATENSIEEKKEISREELKALLRQQLAYEIKQRDTFDQNRER